MANHYDTLGLNKTATDEEIKKAFRKLSRQYHPDLNSSPEAVDKYKAVNEAHSTLGDKEKRAMYDRQGASFGSFSGFGNGGAKVDFDEFFKQYSAKGGKDYNPNADLADLLAQMNSKTEKTDESTESFGSMFTDMFGNAKNTASSKFSDIFNKDNQGAKKDKAPQAEPPTANITISFEESLADSTHTVDILGKSRKVRIPAGIKNGQKIRLKEADNAIIKVKVKTSDYFYWKDGNLTIRVPITLKNALHGGSYSFRLPDGTELSTNLPPHCANRPLRMAGKGVGGVDLILRPYISFPKETTEQDLIAELS